MPSRPEPSDECPSQFHLGYSKKGLCNSPRFTPFGPVFSALFLGECLEEVGTELCLRRVLGNNGLCVPYKDPGNTD